MMGCTRPPPPAELDAFETWTAAWLERRLQQPSARFGWPRIGKGRRLNEAILPALLAMTSDHCAYCDGWPLDVTGKPSIDHFQPKHAFPELAFAWTNLFPACERCQGTDGKGAEWNDEILRPDALDYTFERYFRYVHADGRLEANPVAHDADQRRAHATIELFGLNRGGRPQARRRAKKLYPDNHERPFRFVFDAV